MKQYIGILICFLGISTYAATEERKEIFTATLPDGKTIELVGLRSYSVGDPQRIRDKSGPWWRPDGTQLITPPDEGLDCSSWSDSYLFVINVEGKADCSYKAVGLWDTDLTVQHTKETAKGQEFANKDIRRFTLRCSDRKSTDIRLAVAIDDWKVTERWPLSERTPCNHFFASSKQVIMRCSEQKGTDVIAEVTQNITDRATRLVVFDRQKNQYASYGNEGGNSSSLMLYIHRFKNLNFNDIEHIEFQTRPYEYWITFRNVSLQTGHKTQVEVDLKKPGTLLPGEALPNFNGIKINFSVQDSKSKMLLVCFFDMQQRPSRYCLRQLSTKAQELKAKDIVMIAVQATKIDENSLKQWVKENNIPFPVGMVQGDEEKIRFTWGVRSLPWLILTDTNQIVRAERFNINELNERLIKEKKP
jgi:hypothetical protein